MAKTVAIIQARMGSTRLPGKVMMNLGTGPVLHWVWSAARNTPEVDEVVVATSTLDADNIIADWCLTNNISIFRGSETDVLSRFAGAAKSTNADIVLRLTGDCPLLDPAIIGQVIRLRAMTNSDYATNTDPPTWPDGLDVECFTREALETAHKEATRSTDRDCVTRFIIRNRHRFPAANLTCPLPGLHKERWVLDTKDDLKFCQAIADRLSWDWSPSYMDILRILDKEPELRKLNAGHPRNERFYEALANEPIVKRSYSISQKLFKRAEKIIPFAAQTFSKSHLQFPPDSSPLFVTHGDGAYVYDCDGNDFVDLVQALLPNILGYRDPDVDEAIRRQLNSGISFSLATELESKLAERLIKHIPCAEMVKFGKNGSDVTTAAVRLARAYTKRDKILTCSQYHGWSDAFVAGTERGLGVPEAISNLTVHIPFGDAQRAKDELSSELYAAVIVDPCSNREFLLELRRLTEETGTVLIFDEIITGMRWHIGGAQTFYNVIPDLTTLGKALANGMPLSALVGRKEIMRLMEPPGNIFFSGTFMGEALSLAAAIATVDKLERENVPIILRNRADYLRIEFRLCLHKYGMKNLISIDDSPIGRMKFDSPALQKSFIKAMIASRTLIIGSNNISFAHKEPELRRIVKSYNYALSILEPEL